MNLFVEFSCCIFRLYPNKSPQPTRHFCRCLDGTQRKDKMALNPLWLQTNESKRVFKEAIERLVERVEGEQHESLSLTEYLLKRLEVNWDGYTRESSSFEGLLVSNRRRARHDSEFENTGRIYDQARRTLRQHIARLNSSEVVSTPKVSEISLPKFGGKRTEWSPWAALVQSTVINTNLAVHNKIAVIYAALEGAAKACVGIPEGRDEAELDRIWNKLQEVYENKYLLTRAHIAIFMDLTALSAPSPSKMQIMIDKTQHSIRALERLGVKANHWDALICDILLRKLDPETLNAWEMSRDVDSLPNLQKFFDFMHKRIQAVLNARPDSVGAQRETSNANKRRRDESNREWKAERSTQNASNDTPVAGPEPSERLRRYGRCPYQPACKDKQLHFLWNCRAFRLLENKDRRDFLVKSGICTRCVVEKHEASGCNARTCGKCQNDMHNTILCPAIKPYVKSEIGRSSGSKLSGNHQTGRQKP